MVPADGAWGVPGADDAAILSDIVQSLGHDVPLVRQALGEIAAKAGGAFATLDRDRREKLINEAYAGRSAAMVALGRVVVAAYYRDDRVLMALKFEPRPPFPEGYALEQGDWSLLDAVRNRPPFWRDDRGTSAGER